MGVGNCLALNIRSTASRSAVASSRSVPVEGSAYEDKLMNSHYERQDIGYVQSTDMGGHVN